MNDGRLEAVYAFLMMRWGTLYVGGEAVWSCDECLCEPGHTVRFRMDLDSGALSLQVNDRFFGEIYTIGRSQMGRPVRPSCSCLPPNGAFELIADDH